MKNHIKEIRESKNMSKKDLISSSGISRHTIDRLESGDFKNIYISTLRKLAKGLGVPVSTLIT